MNKSIDLGETGQYAGLQTALEDALGLSIQEAIAVTNVVAGWGNPRLWHDVFAMCESPIERKFLLGATRSRMASRRTDIEGGMALNVSGCPWQVLVLPQVSCGDEETRCRVDFLLRFGSRLESYKPRRNRPRVLRFLPMVAIELDGHEFHERTKEQASQDRRRDRFLASIGFTVLRFTGADVHRDGVACFEEALLCLLRSVKYRYQEVLWAIWGAQS